MDYAPVRYFHLFEYARGTLELRKKRNRKRTTAGDFVWTDDADLCFAWGGYRTYLLSNFSLTLR